MKHKRDHDSTSWDVNLDSEFIQDKSPRITRRNLRSSVTVDESNIFHPNDEEKESLPVVISKYTFYNISKVPEADIFDSCLSKSEMDDDCVSPACLSRTYLLQRALSIQELKPSSWLTSSLMNLALSRFAREYVNVRFMPIDFSLLIAAGSSHSKRTANDDNNTIDILGRTISCKDFTSPLIIIFNSNQIHWNLLRVIYSPKPELQLFEPMGKPTSRHGGLSYRNIPRSIISWLDSSFPLIGGRSWINIGESAITRQQQINSYDCGVACLLYAEKCGQEQSKGKINEETDQQQISQYRIVLQDFTKNANMN